MGLHSSGAWKPQVNGVRLSLSHRLGADVCAILRLSGPLKEQYAQVGGSSVAPGGLEGASSQALVAVLLLESVAWSL